MRNHLFIVRKEDVALDDEEYHIGIRALGAGIRDGNRRLLGALGLIAPSVRFNRAKLRELVPAVKKCAFDISAELGFKALASENPREISETLKT